MASGSALAADFESWGFKILEVPTLRTSLFITMLDFYICYWFITRYFIFKRYLREKGGGGGVLR